MPLLSGRHGWCSRLWKKPEYTAWCHMKARCQNQRHKYYKYYGGRGISVCDRWQIFQNFIEDMGRRPSSKHSLDRINNDGNYEPGNCRWATKADQMLNRRVRRTVPYHGRKVFFTDLLGRCDLLPDTLWTRIKRGWDIDEALTTPYCSKGETRNDHSV